MGDGRWAMVNGDAIAKALDLFRRRLSSIAHRPSSAARRPPPLFYEMGFVHLHCHSEFSLLDGANRIDDLIRRAQEFEQPGLAITDHGNLHAAWEFQEKAKKAGVKPIIGMEAYVAPGSRRERARTSPGAKPY